MKYYEGHEAVYQRLERDGQTCWDRRAFDDFFMKPFMSEALKRMTFQAKRPRALELGCGTGPGACFLAQQGFDVVGIDISETAVRNARSMAAQRGLSIDFRVADICSLTATETFDLIVDSHALHCIVTDDDRRATYAGIRRALRPAGYFISETMIHSPAMAFAQNFRYEADGTLWVEVRADHELGATKLGEKWYLRNRRILPATAFQDELRAAGFEMVWSRHDDQSAAREPDQMQVICQGRGRQPNGGPPHP